MGAVQSDLKSNIVQASAGDVVIPRDLVAFWSKFWQRPETAEHVFETITPNDIRLMRDNPRTFPNLETLVSNVSEHLIHICRTSNSLTEKDGANGAGNSAGREALNCIRILTRVLPFIYESDDPAHREWEQNFFWQVKHSVQSTEEAPTSLGIELTDSLLDLAFWSGFTLPSNTNGQDGPTYGFWQSGIACEKKVPPSRDFESRRTEILQLLLVLESKCIYSSMDEYLHRPAEAVAHISNHPDQKRVQYLLCSLLNTVLKYQPSYHSVGDSPRDIHETHVRTCLHFLHVNLLNRAPWTDETFPAPANEFRDFFSHLHKPPHLQFLAEGIVRIMRQPLEPSNQAMQLVQRPFTWAHETIPLLWEALHCNKYFRKFICETNRTNELLVFLLFYALEDKPKMDGVVRVSLLCLQAISESSTSGRMLNKPFEGHEALPTFMQIKNFHGTYADFLITSLLGLLKPDEKGRLNPMYASVVGIVVNVSPSVVNLGRATSMKLLQVLDQVTRDPATAASESNTMVALNLVRALNAILEEYRPGHENDNTLWAIWKHTSTITALCEARASIHPDFKILSEELATNGLNQPTSSPDGTVLLPLVESTWIVEASRCPLPRFKRHSRLNGSVDEHDGTLAPSTARLPPSLSNEYSDPGSSDAAEPKKGTSSSKAIGKRADRPQSGQHRSEAADRGYPMENLAPVGSELYDFYLKVPLSASLSLVKALEAWGRHLLEERSIEPSPDAVEALSMTELLVPIHAAGRICEAPSERILHRFSLQPPFTAMYAAFYWAIVISQDLERTVSSGSGIWSNTDVKLFRIMAGQAQTPTLFSPKGAVDAVGETLLAGFQNLTMKARQGLANNTVSEV